MPILNTRFEWGQNDRALAKQLVSDATQMLKSAGAKEISLPTEELPPGGFGIHEMGTARMGRDPETSFLNGHNQSHACGVAVVPAELLPADGAAHRLQGVAEGVGWFGRVANALPRPGV